MYFFSHSYLSVYRKITKVQQKKNVRTTNSIASAVESEVRNKNM